VTAAVLLAGIMSLALLHGRPSQGQPPAAQTPPATATPATLLDQGPEWDARMRALYHYTPQGSRLMPRAWFTALERPSDQTAFTAPENLRQYGLIYADDDAGMHLNPDGLPIGFAVDPYDDPGIGQWVGLTCAACHSNEITHRGTRLRIEGAPAMFDFDRFAADLNASVQATARDPEKFARLAERLGVEPEALEPRFAAYAAASENLASVQRPTTSSGFARVDALGQIINALAVLQLGEPANRRPPAAPTSYPFLWTAPSQDWLQWVPIASSPIARNAGEVLGVFGHADLMARAWPRDLSGQAPTRFASTVRFRDLFAIESWLEKLAPPRWPEQLLGEIDETAWREGRGLVEEHCLSCHTVPPNYRMTSPEKAIGGRTFIQVGIVPIEKVGTDPAYLAELGRRQVFTGGLADLFGGRGIVPAPEFFGAAVRYVTLRGLETLNLTPQEKVAFNGFRLTPAVDGGAPRPWATPEQHFRSLKAGPLVGLWATGPFLHNGSVPTLDDLLSPPAERPAVFWTGGRELDTRRFGFFSDEAPGRFRFDTSLPGNRNIGHAFPPTPFTPEQRLAVIEYLKDPERFTGSTPIISR
jgi:mono/diheme cytochrome c family protein